MTRRVVPAALVAALLMITACTAGTRSSGSPAATGSSATASPAPRSPTLAAGSSSRGPASTASQTGLPGMPRLLDAHDVYAADRPGMLSPTVAHDRAYVYVPDTISGDVYVIDQKSMRVVRTFPGGNEPQHVVPSYDLKTLYVTADKPGSGGLVPIDPRTGTPGRTIRVDDAYNMYFTPNGRYAIVVQEAYTRLAFYDPHTFALHDYLTIPACKGIDHLDFSADGTKLLASCEFSAQMAVVDVATHKLLKMIRLPDAPTGMPQDVKLAPDGSVFYVADMVANGIYVISAKSFRVLRFQPTGKGAHGLYVARDSKRLFVTNRDEGSITVIDLATGKPQTKWRIPGGGSPDMGNVSADGKVLWLSGRYNNVVYAINATDGHLIAKIPVGSGPHGLCVWPIPGRYSLGHTGILR
ncbi:MAG: YncE family protein [Jatrophihabitans sp.]